MLLKTIFLPLWLASLGASVAIPIRKLTSSCDRYPLTDGPESEFWCCPVEGGPYTPS